MFLLNDQMILKHKAEGFLDIEEMDINQLLPTYYYFRLGKYFQLWDETKKIYNLGELGEPGSEILTIPPKGYALIQSLERFTCSKRVLALFGQISALPRMGLQLHHSPTIDPNFKGYLEIGLENILNKNVEIKYGESIGKILYFDISDTYPIRDIQGTISEKDYKRREDLKGAEPLM